MKSKVQSRVSPARIPLVALLLAVAGFLIPRQAAAGSFTSMTTALPGSFSPGHMLLLPDGRVMVQNFGNSGWKFLCPDSTGHYVDGTWSNCPSMNLQRLYYASDVLTNGQVFIAGGEYNNNDISSTNAFGLPAGGTAELFNPQAGNGAGSWSIINPPTSLLNPATNVGDGFFDAESVVLSTGNVLVAPVFPSNNDPGGTLIYNPAANAWSVGDAASSSSQDEASWVKLPDDSILTIDPYGTDCERYLPASNTWVQDQPVPVNLYSTNGEIGAAMLLTNGTVLFFGGNQTNTSQIYTPSPLGGTNWGSWSPGPGIPNGLVMRDAPGCILDNGKLLPAFVGPSGDSPFYFYEYNPDTKAFNLVFTDTNSISDGSSMLQLPDGTVLFNDISAIYVYQPDPSPLPAGRPAIHSGTWNADGSLHLTGTQCMAMTPSRTATTRWCASPMAMAKSPMAAPTIGIAPACKPGAESWPRNVPCLPMFSTAPKPIPSRWWPTAMPPPR